MTARPAKALLRDAAAQLAAAGIDNPGYEARLLVAAAAGTDQAGLLRDPDHPVDTVVLEPMLRRRLAHEPMAYILGHCDFWTLTLAVSPATLIPRPDSETLIEAALAARPDRAAVHTILDLGTGTGCLLLAALAEFPAAWGLGVDRIAPACILAATNATANGLAARTSLICGDWAAAVAGRFDLIFSNPPYIPRDSIAGLMLDVAKFEPSSALDGGTDGYDAYRDVIATLPRLLAPGGVAILELGAGQAGDVQAMAQAAGFSTGTRNDLGGHARALVLHASTLKK